MPREKFNLVLQSSRMVTPRVMELRFQREDGKALEYTSGQFITLHIPHAEKLLRRSYSVSAIPGVDDEIIIAATYVDGGRATGILFDMQPGDSVEATGPFGRFVLRDDPPSRYILVATGTGVSPYRAMLPRLKERFEGEDDFEALLLLGVRAREELLYGSDFEVFAEQESQFDFIACYSRDMPERPSDHERSGYVQHTLKTVDVDPERDIVYLCGNPGMIDEAVAHLKENGFNNKSLRREKYVSSN